MLHKHSFVCQWFGCTNKRDMPLDVGYRVLQAFDLCVAYKEPSFFPARFLFLYNTDT